MKKIRIKFQTFFFEDTVTNQEIEEFVQINMSSFPGINEAHSCTAHLDDDTIIIRGDDDFHVIEIEQVVTTDPKEILCCRA